MQIPAPNLPSNQPPLSSGPAPTPVQSAQPSGGKNLQPAPTPIPAGPEWGPGPLSPPTPAPGITVNYGNGSSVKLVTQGSQTLIKPTSGPITIDVDGDGKPDITVTPDPTQTKPVGVDINGDGKIDFQVQGKITVNPSKGNVGLDLDGDGKPDIVYPPPTTPPGSSQSSLNAELIRAMSAIYKDSK